MLHGSAKNILKVDCGEFQMEHEVAKLIGAPPGYLGHRETQPMLTQQKLNAVTSERSELSLVLFDEIEKAAPSMTRLLLGVLDKGVLRLGDNSTVNFEKSLVFLTSNLGAREMMREINPDFGFQSAQQTDRADLTGKLQSIGLVAVRKRFSPEFVNRIDAVITYQPLRRSRLHPSWATTSPSCRITSTRVWATVHLRSKCRRKRGSSCSTKGTSSEYGARELNRTIHRYPHAAPCDPRRNQSSEPRSAGSRRISEDGEKLNLRAHDAAPVVQPMHPTVLLVDDNRDLLHFLERLMADAGWRLLTAESAPAAKRLMAEHKPDAALLDYMLPDGNGVELGVDFAQTRPGILVIVMTGTILPPEEEVLCEENNFPVLRKPFLASDVMAQIRTRLATAAPA